MKAKKKPDWKEPHTNHRPTGCQSASGVLLLEWRWNIKHHGDIWQRSYLVAKLTCQCS